MNYYEEIKQELVNNETYKRVKDYSKNKSDLNTYYNVGKLLVEAQGGEKRAKYGNKLIKEYAEKLTNELGEGYSDRNLRNMRRFYIVFKDKKWNALRTVLSWTHYRQLIYLDDYNKINYYINVCINQNLTYRQLSFRIKNKEYERLPSSTKNKLIEKENVKLSDMIKDPIIIKNKFNASKISEKLLQTLILEDIGSFMKELGEGFCFIDNEYKIKLGNRYNYIDLLLFNYIYNSFVVIELKITELKAEYIGQIKKYMGYIDKNIKSINQNDTIGIIICKKENKFVMEYCSDKRILQREYKLI